MWLTCLSSALRVNSGKMGNFLSFISICQGLIVHAFVIFSYFILTFLFSFKTKQPKKLCNFANLSLQTSEDVLKWKMTEKVKYIYIFLIPKLKNVSFTCVVINIYFIKKKKKKTIEAYDIVQPHLDRQCVCVCVYAFDHKCVHLIRSTTEGHCG